MAQKGPVLYAVCLSDFFPNRKMFTGTNSPPPKDYFPCAPKKPNSEYGQDTSMLLMDIYVPFPGVAMEKKLISDKGPRDKCVYPRTDKSWL